LWANSENSLLMNRAILASIVAHIFRITQFGIGSRKMITKNGDEAPFPA